jgi:hypothetical protein
MLTYQLTSDKETEQHDLGDQGRSLRGKNESDDGCTRRSGGIFSSGTSLGDAGFHLQRQERQTPFPRGRTSTITLQDPQTGQLASGTFAPPGLHASAVEGSPSTLPIGSTRPSGQVPGGLGKIPAGTMGMIPAGVCAPGP